MNESDPTESGTLRHRKRATMAMILQLTYDRPRDAALTDWRTSPRLCLKLAFLRAHAVMLLARRKLR